MEEECYKIVLNHMNNILRKYANIKKVCDPEEGTILEMLTLGGSVDYNFIAGIIKNEDLGTYLSKLEREGYIKMEKGLFRKKPRYEVTKKGRIKCQEYLDNVVKILGEMVEKLTRVEELAKPEAGE